MSYQEKTTSGYTYYLKKLREKIKGKDKRRKKSASPINNVSSVSVHRAIQTRKLSPLEVVEVRRGGVSEAGPVPVLVSVSHPSQ